MEDNETIHAKVDIGEDGLLNLRLPTHLRPGKYDVTLDICEIASEATEKARQEEWRRYVMESHGSIDDPTFFRHDQGKLETRDEWP
jgi:hypothetical protein